MGDAFSVPFILSWVQPKKGSSSTVRYSPFPSFTTQRFIIQYCVVVVVGDIIIFLTVLFSLFEFHFQKGVKLYFFIDCSRDVGGGTFNRVFVLEARTSERQSLGQMLYFPFIFLVFGFVTGN